MGDNTTHSNLSPSKRHRWGSCPGSIREEAKYPEAPSGPAALDGTRTHAILEYCINADLIGPMHLAGTVFKYDHDGAEDSFLVDTDRANRVNVAVEYIRERVKETGGTAVAEQRVHPDGYVLRGDMSGTVDCQIVALPLFEIIDYKDGMSPVQAKDNHQLEIYGIGALAGLSAEVRAKVKTVRLTIIQPKLTVKGMPAITSHDIPAAELLAKVPGIIAEAAATDDPNAPLVPGESQCKYCRAKGACPALANKAMNEVNLMFQAVPGVATPVEYAQVHIPEVIPPGVLDPAQQAALQDPTVMGDDQLRQILEAAPLVRQMLEGVEAEVKRRLESGKPVAGFKLVQGRGSRKWALPEDEMMKKLTGMGIPKGSVYVTTLVSPAQAEKLVWEKKGEKASLSETQLKRMEKEYVVKQQGKPTVAPESDPRPAINLNAAPMFQAVPEAPTLACEAPTPVPDWLAVPAWLQ